jgi:hypothetical protein
MRIKYFYPGRIWQETRNARESRAYVGCANWVVGNRMSELESSRDLRCAGRRSHKSRKHSEFGGAMGIKYCYPGGDGKRRERPGNGVRLAPGPTVSQGIAEAKGNHQDICQRPLPGPRKVENLANLSGRCDSNTSFSALLVFSVGDYWLFFVRVVPRSGSGLCLEQRQANGYIGGSASMLAIFLVKNAHQSRELNGTSMFLRNPSCRTDFPNSASQPHITFPLLALFIFPFCSGWLPGRFQSHNSEILSAQMLFSCAFYFASGPLSEIFEKLGHFVPFVFCRFSSFSKPFPIRLHSPPFYAFTACPVSRQHLMIQSSALRFANVVLFCTHILDNL